MNIQGSNSNLLPPMARIYDVLQQSGRRLPHHKSGSFNYGTPTVVPRRSYSNSKSSRSYRLPLSRSKSAGGNLCYFSSNLPLPRHPGDVPVEIGKSPVVDFHGNSSVSTVESLE